jgi:hypothetical protein
MLAPPEFDPIPRDRYRVLAISVMINPMEQEHPHTHYKKEHGRPPYWKRAHHDWKFWVAIVLMLLGMWVYLRSNDLSLLPHNQVQQRVP